MNDLSFFLYFAEVVSSLSILLNGFGVLGLFASVGCLIPIAINVADDIVSKSMLKFPIIGTVASIFMLFIAAFIPSTETIYMIAASEFGEDVLVTEKNKEIMSDLQELIREKINKAME